MKKFLAGFLSALVLTGGVYATTTIQAELRNDIKISVSGTGVELIDLGGNKLTPILYQGTTYLPIRSVADIFKADIKWIPETKVIDLTPKSAPNGDEWKFISLIKEYPNESAVIDSFIDAIKGKLKTLDDYIYDSVDMGPAANELFVIHDRDYNKPTEYRNELLRLIEGNGNKNPFITIPDFSDAYNEFFAVSANQVTVLYSLWKIGSVLDDVPSREFDKTASLEMKRQEFERTIKEIMRCNLEIRRRSKDDSFTGKEVESVINKMYRAYEKYEKAGNR